MAVEIIRMGGKGQRTLNHLTPLQYFGRGIYLDAPNYSPLFLTAILDVKMQKETDLA
jgi:hypothetical protein